MVLVYLVQMPVWLWLLAAVALGGVIYLLSIEMRQRRRHLRTMLHEREAHRAEFAEWQMRNPGLCCRGEEEPALSDPANDAPAKVGAKAGAKAGTRVGG